MPGGEYIASREELRNRLQQALQELPLAPEVIAKVIPPLLRSTEFLDRPFRRDSAYFDFKSKVVAVVDHFTSAGLTLPLYLKVVSHQPTLFAQSPGGVIANIEGVVDRFRKADLTLEDYLKAAVKRPQLFCQSPGRIAANIEGVVDHFGPQGLRLEDYLGAALRNPPLFTFRPRTVIGHMNLLIELYEKNLTSLPRSDKGDTPLSPLFEYLTQTKPALLAFEDENLALREVYAAILQPGNLNALTRSRGWVEAELARELDHPSLSEPVPKLNESEGRQSHARNLLLRGLIRNGMIKGGTINAR